MSLAEFVKKQFIDVIQWMEADDETLAWRFPNAKRKQDSFAFRRSHSCQSHDRFPPVRASSVPPEVQSVLARDGFKRQPCGCS